MRFKLIQPYDDSHTIGQFRISVTTRNGPLPSALPDNIKQLLEVARRSGMPSTMRI